MGLSDLPIELLESSLLLSATSQSFRVLVLGAELEWRARLAADFNVRRLGSRRSGFANLYRRFRKSRAYVWGASGQGRLGLSSGQLRETFRRDRLADGVATPHQLSIDATLVAIEAGGWSLVMLDTNGRLWITGCLDAEAGFAGPQSPFSDPSRVQTTPLLLPVTLPPIRSHACGRSHILALDKTAVVYELTCFGQAMRVHDASGKWQSASSGVDAKRVVAIAAGWKSSAVLLRNHSAFVWFQPDTRQRADEDEDEGSHETSSIYAIYDRFVESVELPALPSVELDQPEIIAELALGDIFAVALSERGEVFKISLECPAEQHVARDADGNRERYNVALRSGRIAWQHLPLFKGANGSRVTHIKATYKHFAALSAAASAEDPQSSVLLGDADTIASTRPVCPPLLQDSGVIAVGLGDHHVLALTQEGKVLALGEASKGRLGNREASRQVRVTEPVQSDVPGFAWCVAASGWHSACLVLDA